MKNYLDLSTIKDVELNNFETYEKFLFSDISEWNYKDRFEKFIKRGGIYNNVQGFYMPFIYPQTAKEFALNHYVYWNCLGYLKMKLKMFAIYDYNTEIKIDFGSSACWGCEYGKLIASHMRIFSPCEYCPLWSNKESSCLDFDSIYTRWANDNEDVETEIACMPWEDYDSLLTYDFLNVKKGEEE